MDFNLSPEAIMAINFTVGLVIALAVRDIVNNFVQGALFYFDSNFRPGHTVYIDGEKAVIINIGLRKTTFRLDNDRGTTWRFVQNDRIKTLKLEKVVEDKSLEHIEDMGSRLKDIEIVLAEKDIMKTRCKH